MGERQRDIALGKGREKTNDKSRGEGEEAAVNITIKALNPFPALVSLTADIEHAV